MSFVPRNLCLAFLLGLILCISQFSPARGQQGDGAARAQKESEKMDGEWLLTASAFDGKKSMDKRQILLRVKDAKYQKIAGEMVTDHGDIVIGLLRPYPAVKLISKMTKVESIWIYQIDANSWQLCGAAPDAPLPKELSSTPGSGHVLLVYTRVKREEDKTPKSPPLPEKKSDAKDLSGAEVAKAESEKLNGDWKVISSVFNGKQSDGKAPIVLRIMDGKFVREIDSKVQDRGDIQFGISNSLKAMKLLSKTNGGTAVWIYRFQEGRLQLCGAAPGEPTPREFASAPGSQHVLQTFERLQSPSSTPSVPPDYSSTPLGFPQAPFLVPDAGGHTDSVTSALFTRDGKQLVTLSNDKTIRFWDVANGQCLRTLRPAIGAGPVGMLYAGAISPDGKVLAATGYGRIGYRPIYLIDLASGHLNRVLLGHENGIVTLAFSSDGQRLASGSGDETARVWNVRTGECTHVLKGHSDTVQGVAFSPDARQLATASFDRTARIWSLESGQAEQVLQGHTAEVFSVAWSEDGKRIATGGFDQSIRLWESNGKFVHSFDHLRGRIGGLKFIAKDQELLFDANSTGQKGSNDRAGCLDLYKSGDVRVEVRHGNTIRSVNISPDGTLAVSTGGDNSEIVIWRTNDGTKVLELTAKSKRPMSTAWSGAGDLIAWGTTRTGRFATPDRTFNLETLEFGKSPDDLFVGPRREVEGVSLHFEEGKAFVKRGGSTIALAALDSPQEFIRLGSLISTKHVAISTNFGLYLFDATNGQLIRKYLGHASGAGSVSGSLNGRFLLSAGDDYTLRVWTIDRPEPLLSLFFAGDEWIAWTPNGYYAASPGGEQLMGWHVNNGPDQMASYFPAARFRNSLYRPDVIKVLLMTGNVEAAVNAADRALGKKPQQIEIADVLPPKIRITSPERGTGVKTGMMEVKATAESAGHHPVQSLQLLIDGRPLLQGRVRVENPKPGAATATWNITLTAGKQRLSVKADSAVSSAVSEEIEITYQPPDPVESVRLPNLYVLAVGVSDYPKELKLNYAHKDAEVLAMTLRTHGKALFERIEVKELLNEQATQREIRKGISWLSKQMTQRDVGIVFLAGHGEIAANGAFYYLPADVDPEEVSATGLPGDEIKNALAAMPGRLIFMLDACHSGGFENKKRNSRSLTDDLIRDLVADERGVVALCASTGRQFALESNEHRHGIFTLAIIEALQGKAAKVEGAVYLHHLDAYVTDRVKALSQGRQSPTTARPASVRSFPLTKP